MVRSLASPSTEGIYQPTFYIDSSVDRVCVLHHGSVPPIPGSGLRGDTGDSDMLCGVRQTPSQKQAIQEA